MNETIQKAAIEAAARTAQRDVTPTVTMREGQDEFEAVAKAGAGRGEVKEPVSTEADIVAPTAGAGTGDRLVEPKKAKPTKVNRTNPMVLRSAPPRVNYRKRPVRSACPRIRYRKTLCGVSSVGIVSNGTIPSAGFRF